MDRAEIRPAIRYEYLPVSFVEKRSERILSALFIAAQIHEGDKRKLTGEPYLHHCIAVASILSDWGADEDEVVAGLLHDTVEDHPDLISLEDIKRIFGDRVSQLVDGVTKLKSREGDKNEFETLRKVTRESLIEPGVALVKLADRLHNMMTLEGMKPSTQQEKARETLAVYGPLAESFGLWQVKNALQDLSFKFIDPVRYGSVSKTIDRDPRLNQEFIFNKENEIKEELHKYGIEALVEHQVGGYWELSDKQRKSAMRADSRPKSFSDITDVISFRIIVDDDKLGDCYKAMGVMRMRYGNKLEKVRHDDYLVQTATNGYSALHDSYKFEEGSVELAFTTIKREKFNNWGVVSLPQEELKNSKEKYLRKLVFTPKEELVFMEPTATGVDVAYKLSATLGIRATAIHIDGKLCELSAIVPNISLVEIVTEPGKEMPNKEWLEYCNEETRKIIEQQLTIAEHDQEIIKGKNILTDRLLKQRGILNLEDLDQEVVNKILLDLGCWYGLSDLYYKVAYGLDLEVVKKRLEDNGIVEGLYTTIEVSGKNYIGISQEVAFVIAKNGGDTRTKLEKVSKEEMFIIRILMVASKENKKLIETELKERFDQCIIV